MKYLKLFETGTRGKSIRIIKIDCRKRSVDLIEEKDWSDEKMYDLIGHNCNFIESPWRDNNGDSLIVDEEFLIKQHGTYIDEKGVYNPNNFGFVFLPWSNKDVILGNGLIIGSDREGDTDSVKTSLADIRQRILFVDKYELEGRETLRIWQWSSEHDAFRRVR